MASIFDWSSTAATNATADSDITWAEGQNPNTVNDSARQMMKRVRDLVTDIAGGTLATGTANGLLLTAANAFTALATGRIVCFRAASDNTGAATLNVNGIGAKSIRYITSDGDTAIAAGMIQAGGIYVAIYGAHLNSAAGGWMLLNPTSVEAALTTVDNTIPRFDGTAGALQTSGVTLSDANVFSGGAWNGTVGATTPASGAFTTISGTTGTFSSTLGVTGIGTFASQLRADSFVGTNGTTNLIMGTTGAGTVNIRPNGVGSATGQMVIASTGAVTINGTLTVTG